MNILLFSSLLTTAISAEPSAKIKNGLINGFTSNKVENFFGIPYADPPVGDLRLRKPRPLSRPLGAFNATSAPRACVQKTMAGDLPILEKWPPSLGDSILAYNATIENAGEDCLTLNIQRPVGTEADAKLPVLFWIYGGAFEIGSTGGSDWSTLVTKSIELGGAVIVAVNYRLNSFGFLGGKELQEDGATNLGLRDQRLGLEWVHDNIEAFGGDPDKVTLWGQSAGSISVHNHLLINNGDHSSNRTGKPLFRAAIMDSGTSFNAEPVDSATAQAQYDFIVSSVGCASSAPSHSSLECLRKAPLDKIIQANNNLPRFISQDGLIIDYVPRPDTSDNFYTTAKLAPGTPVADVPLIVAHQEDETTIFMQATSEVTSNAALVSMLQAQYPTAPRASLDKLVSYYANTTGAPFRTTNASSDAIYPNSRINSAVSSDVLFVFNVRSFLDTVAGPEPCYPQWKSPVYALQGSYFHGTPVVGTYHGSDLYLLGSGSNGVSTEPFDDVAERYLRFVKDGVPAYEGGAEWAVYGEERNLLRVNGDGEEMLKFDFREEAYQFFKSVEDEILF